MIALPRQDRRAVMQLVRSCAGAPIAQPLYGDVLVALRLRNVKLMGASLVSVRRKRRGWM